MNTELNPAAAFWHPTGSRLQPGRRVFHAQGHDDAEGARDRLIHAHTVQSASGEREREHHAPVSLACWCDLAVRPEEDGRVGAVAGKGVVRGTGLSNSHRQENAI